MCPQQSQFLLSANETQKQTEFLGVLTGSQLDASTLEEPLQALCQDRSVYWTRRAEGENSNIKTFTNVWIMDGQSLL